jgi:hypothetical protein
MNTHATTYGDSAPLFASEILDTAEDTVWPAIEEESGWVPLNLAEAAMPRQAGFAALDLLI